MKIEAESVDEYFEKVPEERREAMQRLRDVINENIPDGFEETLGYGMPAWVVPHELYPAGYHCDSTKPLPFLSVASQKRHVALYHMGLYADAELLAWFEGEYPKHSDLKLDMGKSCVRFRKPEQIPFTLIAELLQRMSAEAWIDLYENNVK